MNSITSRWTTFVGFFVGLSIAQARADLIVNGSFEEPAISDGTFMNYSSIPGWTADVGEIEIQRGIAFFGLVPSADGEQHVKLASSEPSSMFQMVPTLAGQLYKLTYAYSPRSHANDSTIEVYFKGQLVDSVNGFISPGSADFHDRTFWLRASATTGTSELRFTAGEFSTH